MAESIDEKVRKLVEAPNFCHVATIREDGTPHVVPVWVDADEDHVLLNTAEGRTWPRNARRDPRVTLTISNGENPYEYVSVRGRVVDMTPEGADAHIDAMAKKYMGVDEYPLRTPGEVRLIVRVEPEKTHVFGF